MGLIDKPIQASKRRQKKHWYFRNLEHLYLKAVTDFENDEWVTETVFDVTPVQRTKLLNRVSKELNYKFHCFENDYNQEDQANAFAFALTANSGVLTIPSHSKCISWLIHEVAHCLTGSLVFTRSNQSEFEPHHGPIFQTYLCYCYSLITDKDLEWFQLVALAYPNLELLSDNHLNILVSHYTQQEFNIL